jgi:hypothetical protein
MAVQCIDRCNAVLKIAFLFFSFFFHHANSRFTIRSGRIYHSPSPGPTTLTLSLRRAQAVAERGNTVTSRLAGIS